MIVQGVTSRDSCCPVGNQMACARHVVQRVFSARTHEIKVSFTIRHVLVAV